MKKILYSLLIISLLLISISCSPRNMKINPTPEMPILDGMELENTKNGDTIGHPEGISTYVVENENIDSFLEKYEAALEDEGWTIVDRREPFAIDIEKNGSTATVIAYVSNDEIKVDIIRDEVTQ